MIMKEIKNMSKFKISQNYMETEKQKHPALEKKYDRKGIVVGSNKTTNIGHFISKKLTEDGFSIKELSKSLIDISKDNLTIEGDEDALILSNGYTHIDWTPHFPEDEMMRVINDTFVASIKASRQFINETINSKHKKYIVFIGSMAYNHVLNGSSVYCAAKAGIAHFSKCLAWELAPKGYNILTIHPCNTENTPMTDATINGLMKFREINRKEAELYWGSILPKKRWLQPDEIGDLVSYFLSGKADYMSGGQIELAGGQR
jgi:NAD(P)-dependent dehydrogenase (short-subunit alcohol dehydrogenase family)